MQLTMAFGILLQEFAPVFTQPSFETFKILLTGWCLSFRPRFVTELILSSGSTHDGHHSCYHRFFSEVKAFDSRLIALNMLYLGWIVLIPFSSQVLGEYGGKTPVVGAVERKGKVVCRVLDHVSQSALETFVRQTVQNDVSLLATDERRGYYNLAGYGFAHEAVNHSHKKYVVGAIHTNTIEGFWSLVKRGVMGHLPQGLAQIPAAVRRGISVQV